LITFVALVWGAGARAEQAPPSRGDLLVFASAEGYRLADSEVFDDDVDGVLTTDLLGSWTTGRFRVMGELFVTTEEQDLERLQAGWLRAGAKAPLALAPRGQGMTARRRDKSCP